MIQSRTCALMIILSALLAPAFGQDVEGSRDHPRRAEAVVDVLIKQHGISAGRLKARGVGPLVPAPSNSTDEGRAKNRRVELVQQ